MSNYLWNYKFPSNYLLLFYLPGDAKLKQYFWCAPIPRSTYALILRRFQVPRLAEKDLDKLLLVEIRKSCPMF